MKFGNVILAVASVAVIDIMARAKPRSKSLESNDGSKEKHEGLLSFNVKRLY